MSRRRMISPEFWKDPDIRRLTHSERLFFIGCISHADDEGRLLGHPAYLKAVIFMYDDDLDLETVRELRDSTLSKVQNLKLYTNGDEEYLVFLKWGKHQKPSRPTLSDFPAPPQFVAEPITEPIAEPIAEPITEPIAEPPRASLGQSSLGQYSLGQGEITEDFTKFSDSQDDLTDFLTTILKKSVSAAAARSGREVPDALRVNTAMPVLQKCWQDILGNKMPSPVFDGARKALQGYPLELVAKAFAKGLKYKGGKHKSWKYFQTILKEESQKRERGPPG